MRIALNYQRVDPSKGGAETYVADLCRVLVRAGHEVELFASQWRDDCLPSEVIKTRVDSRGVSKWGRTWSFARNAEAVLRRSTHDCSVGFINTWHQDVLIPQGGLHEASLRANARRFPAGWQRRLYVAGKQLNPKAWLHTEIERRQYRPERKTKFVAMSRLVQEQLERYHQVPPSRIRVIPNAVDAERLVVDDPRAVRQEYRYRHGLAESDLVALFVGHNFRLKGLLPLLETLAFRVERDQTARALHLLVCGGGRIEPIRARVAELGLAKTVHLVGFEPEIRSAYHAADFFVLPTYYDPCSLVVFEALACGLPVITTACNGAGELITRGRQGFVVSSPDARVQLAEALDLMTDNPARRAMSIEAARLGRGQSFERHVSRLVDLFEEVAESKRQARNQRRDLLSPSGPTTAITQAEQPATGGAARRGRTSVR
jgi:UDP-glucose:(heptosyl)LPS alpha-1,3-glucosyltransferase